jgi:Tol biopolymer transport system component
MISFKNISLRLFLVFLLLAFLGAGLVVEAQYFGRNKVQYRKFDFKIMKTKHFDIYFYQQDVEVVKQAAMIAERWYARLSRIFGHELNGRQPLIIYSSSPEFQQTTVIPEIMGEGTGGVTESIKRRIVLPYGVSLAETEHVIGHELVHAFQYDIAGQGHSDQARYTGADLRLPLFLVEGLAEYLSIGPVDPETSMWIRDAWKKKDLPTIKKLENYYKYFPYRYGHALWAYIGGRWGDEMIGKIFKLLARSNDYESALQAALGFNLKKISEDWHKSIEEAYAPLVSKTDAPEKYGRLLLKGTEENVYNVSPVLSPDGQYVAFLSSRDLFSVDLYLADTQTGKIIKKLTSTALDPHFESIQFIKSAGSWSPDGKKFVLGTIARGRAHLSIINVEKEKIEKEIPFPELGEIINPSWSPDGKYIAFSAMVGGVTDIFIYDLENNTLKQMTRDSYGDIHPVWSPDGKKIAFVTERFSANLKWMDPGHYELALLDVETGEISRILGFPSGKNINPQWADSQTIFFLSDYQGKTDLFRLDLKENKIYQVTNLFTGIGGITQLSPAISYSQVKKNLVFSVYEGGHYSVYLIDNDLKLVGQTTLAQLGERPVGLLPPRTQLEGALLGLLRNPLYGLPKETDFPITNYQPKLSLDLITQPTVAVGVDRYGTYAGGGIAALWSDMLGYHTVVTMAQTNTQLIDSYVLVGYQNSKSRINWGAVVQRVPYVYGSYGARYDEINGYPVYVEEEFLNRQINYQFSTFANYPLNTFQRLEFNAGFNLVDFNNRLYRYIYDPYYFELIDYYEINMPAPPSLKFGYVSAALVYDSSIFGACAPIIGQSYLLQVQPTFGDLNFVTVLADYRRYIMPIKPFTLAFRVLHYGRYGGGADDSRLWPLFLGYETLVRGYDYGSFEYAEFDTNNPNAFDFNRLLGSRMLVGNAELRFPVFKVLGLGKGFYGIWPLEFLAFYDVGTAWYSGEKPTWFGGHKKPVSSAGFGLRTNLFGAIVLGFDYVYPFDRPIKGWHWQFTIAPGF